MEENRVKDGTNLARQKNLLRILAIFLLCIIVVGASAFFLSANAKRKVELSKLDTASKAVDSLYADEDCLQLAYMNDDRLIAKARKEVALVDNSFTKELKNLNGKINAAEDMYDDQAVASEAISAFFENSMIVDDLTQEGIDTAFSLVDKVTNQQKYAELTERLALVKEEWDLQQSAEEAVVAVEDAQGNAWNEDLAAAAENAIALITNMKVKTVLGERLTAARQAEEARQNELAKRSSPSSRNQNGGSTTNTNNSEKSFPIAPYPDDWGWACICGRGYFTRAELDAHINNPVQDAPIPHYGPHGVGLRFPYR